MEWANSPKACFILRRLSKIAEELCDQSLIANCNQMLYRIYNGQGKLTEALPYLLAELKGLELLGDKREIASCNLRVSAVYIQIEEYSLA